MNPAWPSLQIRKTLNPPPLPPAPPQTFSSFPMFGPASRESPRQCVFCRSPQPESGPDTTAVSILLLKAQNAPPLVSALCRFKKDRIAFGTLKVHYYYVYCNPISKLADTLLLYCHSSGFGALPGNKPEIGKLETCCGAVDFPSLPM